MGESNENNVIIEQGLEPGTKIFLSVPEDPESFNLVGKELISVIKDKEKALKAEEVRIRQEAEKAKTDAEAKAKASRGGMMNVTPEMMKQFQNNRNRQPRGESSERDTSARTRRNFQQRPQNSN